MHDPGKIIVDLVMTLALGHDCLADVAMLRAVPALAGPVASDPVISCLVSALASDERRRWPRSGGHARRPGSGRGRWPASARRARTGPWSTEKMSER